MRLRTLVDAILEGNLLGARQWVADAVSAGLDWESLERPTDMNELQLCVAAALTEMPAKPLSLWILLSTRCRAP